MSEIVTLLQELIKARSWKLVKQELNTLEPVYAARVNTPPAKAGGFG